jgi:HD-like signal output (HDOD) protein
MEDEKTIEPIDLTEDWELLDGNADQQIIKSIVEYVDQLPPLPVVAQRILQLVRQEETSSQDIAQVISMDTALAAKVLRIVNSAFYSPASPVTTIQRAVAMLGFSELKNMTLGVKIMDTFSDTDGGTMDRDAFWEHSLACGLCAQNLSEKLQQGFPEETFLGGLLHDVGKLVLDAYLTDQWKVVQQQAKKKQLAPLAVEKKVIGVPHTDVGQWLAERWKLPRLHQIAIQHHHDIPTESKLSPQEQAFCGIICAANGLVQWLDLGSSGYSPLREIPKELCDQLGLSERHLEHVLGKTIREVKQWKETLGMREENPPTHGEPSDDTDPSTEAACVLVIGPNRKKVPSVQTLLATLGYEVRSWGWGDKFLNAIPEYPHQAVIMELGKTRVDIEKFIGLLRAIRSRTSVPILLLGSNGLKLPLSKDAGGIYSTPGVPHRGALKALLQDALKGR